MILKRNAADRYSRIAPEWEGETVVLIGGGPSLTVEQVATVREWHQRGDVRCIAINDAYLLAEFADVCYFADAKWYRWQMEGREKPGLTAEQVRQRWRDFAGQKCTIQTAQPYIVDDAVHILRNVAFPDHSSGLSTDPGALATGWNSGFQALNAAILAGAAVVPLLGFDGRPNADGKAHWFGDHPAATPVGFWPQMRRAFSEAQAAIRASGVRVVNCSPGSYLDTFEKIALEDVMQVAA